MRPVIQRFLERYTVRLTPPDVLLLQEIARAFSHLPYENVTKILKDARSITSESRLRQADEVLSDHLDWNTGGTCFSLCNALSDVLYECGFDAFVAMGDMHYGENIHCAVVVQSGEARYLLDPGYLLHQPIPMPVAGLEVARETPMNTVFLRHEGGNDFSLETEELRARKWRYRLHAVRISKEAFVRHWIHSFSLNSMEHLLLSKVNDSGRLYFRKNNLEQVNVLERRKKKIAELDECELSAIFGVPADLIRMAHKVLLSQVS